MSSDRLQSQSQTLFHSKEIQSKHAFLFIIPLPIISLPLSKRSEKSNDNLTFPVDEPILRNILFGVKLDFQNTGAILKH